MFRISLEENFQIRSAGEAHVLKPVGEFAHALLPNPCPVGFGLTPLEESPLAQCQGIAHGAGESNIGARELRAEIFQLPLVAREEPKPGLDVLCRELPRSLVRMSHGPDQPALVQHQAIDLELHVALMRAS